MTVRFSHVVVNVADLARSVAFYEAVTTLRRTDETPAPPQAFASLGVGQGQFTGVLLRDHNVPLAPALHLIEWRDPMPYGRAYDDFTNPGFFRMCFQNPDAAKQHGRAVAAGAQPFTPPLMPEGQNVLGRPVFCMPDPDGVVVQHVTLPGPYRFYHTALNCRDLDTAIAFFEALGLIVRLRAATTQAVRNSFGLPGVEATFDAALLGIEDDTFIADFPSFSLDICQWTEPAPKGDAYPDQIHAGIARLGLAVDDLLALHTRLEAQGLKPSVIEIRDFGPPVGMRQAFTVQSSEGAMVELVDRRL